MSRQVVQDMKKLPKWAQNRIEVLEMNLASAKKEVEQVYSDNPTDTFIPSEAYAGGHPRMNLPNKARVEFKPKDGEAIQVHLMYDDHKGIYVTTNRGTLRVTPWAANVVKIYVER